MFSSCFGCRCSWWQIRRLPPNCCCFCCCWWWSSRGGWLRDPALKNYLLIATGCRIIIHTEFPPAWTRQRHREWERVANNRLGLGTIVYWMKSPGRRMTINNYYRHLSSSSTTSPGCSICASSFPKWTSFRGRPSFPDKGYQRTDRGSEETHFPLVEEETLDLVHLILY